MDPAEWVGRDIDGRYRVESVLGVGGMGTVLRAKHQFTGVAVAIKILHPQFQLDPEVQARFFDEAKAPNAIGHPAIVKVVDANRAPDGTLYMAMELLAGRSLRAAVARRDLSADQIKRIMNELLAALGQAHARGFVHRDLKPDNVFLCAPNDEVKLLDFGIAKMLDDAVRRNRTAAGALLGTPAYMAPEQLADASNVDSRADLWAIGVMLYEMITGRLPLPGSTPNELLVAVASGTVIPIRQVLPGASYELEQFFERALARDPRRRFGAAVELAQALAPLTFGPASPNPAQLGTAATMASQGGGTVASLAAGSAMASQGGVSLAPGSAHSPYTAPVAPQIPFTTEVAAPPPQRSSKALLVVGVLAAIAIVVGIAIAVSGGKSPPIVATADARVAVPDPDPPAPDAAVPPQIADGPSIESNPLARPALTCQQRCKLVASKCSLDMATCVSDCEIVPAIAACMDRATVNCIDGAMCGFGVVCNGRIPSGSASCGSVLRCQIACGGDVDCSCNCDTRLDPKLALVLGRVNTCISNAVVAGCKTEQCVATRCRSQILACK